MNLSHKGFSMAMSVITRWYLRHLGTGDSCWTPLNSHVDRRNQLSLVWVWTTIYLYTYICMYVYIPSGDLSHSYGKYPCWMGKVTISMAIFNSYVSLPGGYVRIIYIYIDVYILLRAPIKSTSFPSYLARDWLKNHTEKVWVTWGRRLFYTNVTFLAQDVTKKIQMCVRMQMSYLYGLAMAKNVLQKSIAEMGLHPNHQ